MTTLVVGLILFFAPHSVAIVNADWRDAQVRRWGEGTWKAGYSLVSALGLVFIIYGYGLARQAPIVLWLSPEWLRHLTLLLMVPVFPLLIAAYVPGRIRAVTRHPMLVAVKLWAVAHLFANGTLADVLLFGAFLIWAVAESHRPQAPCPARDTQRAGEQGWGWHCDHRRAHRVCRLRSVASCLADRARRAAMIGWPCQPAAAHYALPAMAY